MFNHESEYRKDEFLFMKIITTAYKIKKNREYKLKLGSLEYCRDWSYAGDIVEGIMLLTKEGVDFDRAYALVVQSGSAPSLTWIRFCVQSASRFSHPPEESEFLAVLEEFCNQQDCS